MIIGEICICLFYKIALNENTILGTISSSFAVEKEYTQNINDKQ